MRLVKQGGREPQKFYLADAANPLLGKSGLTNFTIEFNKTGSFLWDTSIGTIAEIGEGTYQFTPSLTDFNTSGDLMIKIASTGAVTSTFKVQVVPYTLEELFIINISGRRVQQKPGPGLNEAYRISVYDDRLGPPGILTGYFIITTGGERTWVYA